MSQRMLQMKARGIEKTISRMFRGGVLHYLFNSLLDKKTICHLCFISPISENLSCLYSENITRRPPYYQFLKMFNDKTTVKKHINYMDVTVHQGNTTSLACTLRDGEEKFQVKHELQTFAPQVGSRCF